MHVLTEEYGQGDIKVADPRYILRRPLECGLCHHPAGTLERSRIWAIRKKDKLGAGSACGVREAAGVCVGLGSNKLALGRHSVARIPVRLLDKPYSLIT
jgi:hypothetical protein